MSQQPNNTSKFEIVVYDINGVTQWKIKVGGKLRWDGPASNGCYMAHVIMQAANEAISIAGRNAKGTPHEDSHRSNG